MTNEEMAVLEQMIDYLSARNRELDARCHDLEERIEQLEAHIKELEMELDTVYNGLGPGGKVVIPNDS